MRARPGEVELAHRGVLFLDELPEFPRHSLDSLRQPMETGHTTVARAAAHVTYPARFQLIAAMNPCRCGYLGDAARECGRAPRCGEDYQSRLSGPLLDRIDLSIEVQPTSPAELSRAPPGEASATVAARVGAARRAQAARAGKDGPSTNAEADPHKLELQPEARALAELAAERLRLSPRGFTRTLRVARSIADLAGAGPIRRQDVAEALAFRHRVPGGRSAPGPGSAPSFYSPSGASGCRDQRTGAASVAQPMARSPCMNTRQAASPIRAVRASTGRNNTAASRLSPAEPRAMPQIATGPRALWACANMTMPEVNETITGNCTR